MASTPYQLAPTGSCRHMHDMTSLSSMPRVLSWPNAVPLCPASPQPASDRGHAGPGGCIWPRWSGRTALTRVLIIRNSGVASHSMWKEGTNWHFVDAGPPSSGPVPCRGCPSLRPASQPLLPLIIHPASLWVRIYPPIHGCILTLRTYEYHAGG